jgi:hypothetical protein
VVEIREVVPAGEPGAGPIDQEMVVVHWDPETGADGRTIYRRAMSFTQEQFDALFEEVS